MVESRAGSTERFAPSEQFLETAQQVAQSFRLDTEMVVNGHPVKYGDLVFWLQHYGHADARAMAVMIEIGEMTPEHKEQLCVDMLQEQFLRPVGVNGYYCLLPGTEIIAYALRIDLERTADATAAVLEFVELMAAQKEQATSAFA